MTHLLSTVLLSILAAGQAFAAPTYHELPMENGSKVLFLTNHNEQNGVYHVDQRGHAMLIDPRRPFIFGMISGAKAAELRFVRPQDLTQGYAHAYTTQKFAFALMAPDVLIINHKGEHVRVNLLKHKGGSIHTLRVFSEVWIREGRSYLYLAVNGDGPGILPEDRNHAMAVMFDEDLNQCYPEPIPVDKALKPAGRLSHMVCTIRTDSPAKPYPRDALFTNGTLSRVYRRTEPGMPQTIPVSALLLSEPANDQEALHLKDVTVTDANGDQVSALSVVAGFATNLTEKFKASPIEGLSHDPTQQRRIAEILAGRENANVAYVGHPGVGKTTEVNVLASDAANGRGPKYLHDYTFLSVNARALEVGGKWVGAIAAKIEAMLALSRANKIIWVMDEFHTIRGVGTHIGQASDVTQMMKADLANGNLKIIALSTKKELLAALADDRALIERFQFLEKPEPSDQLLRGMIQGWADQYGYARPSAEVVEEALRIANDVDGVGAQPRKTTRLLDGVYARLRLDGRDGHTPDLKTLHEVARERLNFDPAWLDPALAAKRLRQMSAHLDQALVGQEPLKKILARNTGSYLAGLHRRDQPLMKVLLTGPEGQGKTASAIAYAEGMGLPYRVIEMSQYSAGAYPGAGPLAQAADAVSRSAFTVLIFDEIEKAPIRVQEELLRALNEGRSEVQRQTQVGHVVTELIDFRNTVVFFTANAGAAAVSRPAPGFTAAGPKDLEESDIRELVREGNISRYLLDRVDDVILILPLKKQEFAEVLRRKILTLLKGLEERGVRASFANLDAYIDHLAEQWTEGLSNRAVERLIRPVRDFIAAERLNDQASKPLTLIFADGQIKIKSCEDLL